MGTFWIVILFAFAAMVSGWPQNSESNFNSNPNPGKNEITEEFRTKVEELVKFQGQVKKLTSSLVQLFNSFGETEPRTTGQNTDSGRVGSCDEAMTTGSSTSPRLQKQWIYPHGNDTKVEVLCDFEVDGGGWTVIQRRSSGPRDEFYRNWDEYSKGFGSLDKNFWLGLENIHALTKNGDQELRIEMEDFEGEKAWAKYSSFSISDASDFYRLSIGGFSGNAGDSISEFFNINGAQFSTHDKDNDGGDQNCAQERNGAWWYKNLAENACSHCNLNALYRPPGEGFRTGYGLVWETWRGAETSLKKVQMKIRKRK